MPRRFTSRDDHNTLGIRAAAFMQLYAARSGGLPPARFESEDQPGGLQGDGEREHVPGHHQAEGEHPFPGGVRSLCPWRCHVPVLHGTRGLLSRIFIAPGSGPRSSDLGRSWRGGLQSIMSMKRIKACSAAFTGLFVATVGVLLGFIAWRYLTEYPSSTLIAAVMAAGSVPVAVGIAWLLRRRKSPVWSVAAAAVCLLLCLVVLGSVAWGKVTYSRFGLTVIGALPIPVLDITVSSSGVLWFRDKNHQITLSEVRPLVDESTEILIIGNGWHGAAKVEEAILDAFGSRVHVLRTGEALRAYNSHRAAGRRVVLLVHTTC